MNSANDIVEFLLETDEDFDFDFDFDPKELVGGEEISEIISLIDNDILTVCGNIKRSSNHYVHERTTEFELNWDFNWPESDNEDYRKKSEQIIEEKLLRLVTEIDKEMVQWNRKIYTELEAAYDSERSDEITDDNIRANEYEFDENGNRSRQGQFQFDQLNDTAKQVARDWYRQTSNEIGDNYCAEPVIAEWKWLLKNKGFDGVEIAFSGFWNQGDGASFTADSFDLKRYLLGPDPLTFPEQQREQLDESSEEGMDPKDVYHAETERIPLVHITNKKDYAEYQTRVAEFLTNEGIKHLTLDGTEIAFARTPCAVCKRPLAGSRFGASSYNNQSQERLDFLICSDCLYYMEYGKLDDQTMLEISINKTQESLEDETTDLIKELEPDSPETLLARSGFQRDGHVWVKYLRNDTLGVGIRPLPGNEYVINYYTRNEGDDWKMFHTYVTDITGLARELKLETNETLQEGNNEYEFDPKEILDDPPPEPTFTVTSSWGELTARIDDGHVIEVEKYHSNSPEDNDAFTLDQIARFDVNEWRQYYPGEVIQNKDSIDILDLGFWTKDGTYEPPEENWRHEFRRVRDF